MKKKFLCLVMAVAAISMFAACGNNSDASGDASETTEVQKVEYSALDYVNLGDYKNISIETTQYTVTDAEVDEYVQDILESYAYHEEITDRTVVEDGDYIKLDYAGYQDGEEVDNTAATDQTLTVGSNTMVDGFEDALIGATVGEEVTFDVTFAEDYWSEDMAGQTVTFKATVTAILEEEETIPELTDEWVAENFEEYYTTVEELVADVRLYLEDEAAYNTEQEMLAKLEIAIYDTCSLKGDFPEGLFEYEKAKLLAEDEEMAESYGYELEDFVSMYYGYSTLEEYEADVEAYLEEYLTYKLYREAIIEQEGWELTDEDIDAFLVQYAEYYGYETFDEFVEGLGEANGFTDKESFIELVGEDELRSAALTLRLWDEAEQWATITYVPEEEEIVEDASGDASAEDADEDSDEDADDASEEDADEDTEE